MLELLSLRKGTTLTKEMFLNHLYGGMDEPELKIIDVFICKLRKKLANASSGKNYIETVWGRGYVLREPSDEEAKISACSEFVEWDLTGETPAQPPGFLFAWSLRLRLDPIGMAPAALSRAVLTDDQARSVAPPHVTETALARAHPAYKGRACRPPP